MNRMSFFSAALAILMSFCRLLSHAAAPEEQLIEAMKVALVRASISTGAGSKRYRESNDVMSMSLDSGHGLRGQVLQYYNTSSIRFELSYSRDSVPALSAVN